MNKFISDLKVGDTFKREGEFKALLVSAEKKKSQRGEFLALTYQDKSGVISGNMWEIPSALSDLPERVKEEDGLFVSVMGEVTFFNNANQLTARSLTFYEEKDMNPADFIPVVNGDRKVMWEEVKKLINMVEDQDYKMLLVAVFNDAIIREGYLNAIAAIKHHHNYIGGLLEHSLQVCHIALASIGIPFFAPTVNKDLIITGALLHDIGKIEEYSYSKSMKMNPIGINHRYSGVSIIDRVVYQNKLNIDMEKVAKIKNIIMTHHGVYGDETLRYESQEAILIHHSDGISAELVKEFVPFYTKKR